MYSYFTPINFAATQVDIVLFLAPKVSDSHSNDDVYQIFERNSMSVINLKHKNAKQ